MPQNPIYDSSTVIQVVTWNSVDLDLSDHVAHLDHKEFSIYLNNS